MPDPKSKPKDEGLSAEQKAALVAAIVAASVAAYLATGKPCACPYSTNRAGRACGGTSAWSRAGGCRPLCYPTDVGEAVLAGWLAKKLVPSPC